MDGAAPFNHSGWPSAILAPLRTLTADSWPIEANSAAPPPVSPACEASVCGPREMRLLVPHGGTELRIGELPVAYAHGAARPSVPIREHVVQDKLAMIVRVQSVMAGRSIYNHMIPSEVIFALLF